MSEVTGASWKLRADLSVRCLLYLTFLGYQLVPALPHAGAQSCELYPIALALESLDGVPPGTDLEDIFNGVQPGNFGWLTWTGSPSVPTLALALSLTPPGDSDSYVNPDDPSDTVVSLGDFVQGKPGVSNSKKVRDALEALMQIDAIVPVWDETRGQGNNADYRVGAFARVRLLDFNLPAKVISARFLGFVTCDDFNEPPQVDAGADQSILPSESATLNGTVTDDGLPAPGVLSANWSKLSGPGAVTFGDPASAVTTATFSETGIYELELSAGDQELSGNDTVTVIVNTPPLGSPLASETDEDLPVALTLTGSDADGDPLTFTIVSPPSNGALSSFIPQPSSLQVTFTPNGDFFGVDSFDFVVNDGIVDSALASVTITINPVNDAPIALDDSATVDEGGTVTVLDSTETSVLANDTDAENDPLTAILVAAPVNGAVSLNPNGTFSYTHNGSETTTDSFTYRANDGSLDSANATVTITINPVNDAPIAVDDSTTVDEGGTVTILDSTETSVLGNDSDPENDPLTASLVAGPLHGSVTLNSEGTFSYTHDGSETTSDNFTYRANDGSLESALATVTLTINPVIDVPVADDQSVATDEDTAVAITLSGSDIDGDPLTFAVTGGPANGVLSGTAPNLTYTPNNGFFGGDGFTFVTNDGTVDSAEATVTIAVNALPLISLVEPNDNEVFSLSSLVPVKALVSDPDGAVILVEFFVDGVEATELTEAPYVINLEGFDEGTFELTARATDDLGAARLSAPITIIVAEINFAPVVAAGADQNIGPFFTTGLQGSVADDGLPAPSSLATAWSVVSGPGAVSFTDASSAATTATFGDNGVYVLRLSADDGELISSDEVSVNVAQQNQPPQVDAGADLTIPEVFALSTNLIQNPGNEEALAGGEIPFWTEVVGAEWTQAAAGAGGRPPAFEGSTYFFAGTSGTAELAQDVDVSAFAENIDSGRQVFQFKAFVRMKDELREDFAQVILEYRDINNVVVLDEQGFEPGPTVDDWLLLSDTRIAPPGPGFVRVRLIATQNLSDTTNDAFFDGLALQALTTTAITTDGLVADDGLPVGSGVTLQWTQTGGPAADVVDSTSPNTVIFLPQPGTYTFELSADDSEFVTTDDLAVTVAPALTNQPPAVDAGSDELIFLPDNMVSLAGSVSDDGLPGGSLLSHGWSVVSGPGAVIFDDARGLSTVAHFNEAGDYLIRLAADDGEFVRSDEILVVVDCPDISDQLDFAIVIDTSDSMAGQRIVDAEAAAKNFIDAMSPISDLGSTITFSVGAFVRQSMTNDQELLKLSIDNLGVFGGTAIHAGPASLRRRIKYWPTAGEPRQSRSSS